MSPTNILHFDVVDGRVEAVRVAVRASLRDSAYRVKSAVRRRDPKLYAFLADLCRADPRHTNPFARYPELAVTAAVLGAPEALVLGPVRAVERAVLDFYAQPGRLPALPEMRRREEVATHLENCADLSFHERPCVDTQLAVCDALDEQITQSELKKRAVLAMPVARRAD